MNIQENDKVTISLEKYEEMKATINEQEIEILRLLEENAQKTIIKNELPEWIRSIAFIVFGIGLILLFLKGMHL
jgi:hypothetical protein